MTVWLPVTGPQQKLLVTGRGGRQLVRAYTAPHRLAAVAGPDVDPELALSRPFGELIRSWVSDDLGLVINPDSDTELQLPRHLWPKILKYREQMIADKQSELPQSAEERERAEIEAMRERRVRNQISGDVYGDIVQTGAIHGDVHIHENENRVPDVPVILTTAFDGNVTVVIDSEPPTRPASGNQQIKILVEAHSAQAVILQDLRPVVLSRREPRPVLNSWAALAALSQRKFRVNLDEDPPRLIPTGPVTFPFTVTASDPELFVLTPYSRFEVDWQLELHWTCAGRHGSIVVPDGPFVLHPGPRNAR